MEIKKYEGTLSFDDFTNGLVSYGNRKTFGEVWEKCVTCNNCDYQGACENICEYISARAFVDIKCNQVIDILLGHKKVEDVIEEAKRDDRW